MGFGAVHICLYASEAKKLCVPTCLFQDRKDYSVKRGTSACVVEVTTKVLTLVSEQAQLIISGILM